MIRFNALLVSVLLSLSFGVGCKKKSEKEEHSSGAEKAGKAVDDAADDTRKSAGDAAHDVGDTIEGKH